MIAGYQLYYFKKGKIFDSILTLKSKLIPVEFEGSARELISKNNNTVLSEEVMSKWCSEVGLTLGQD